MPGISGPTPVAGGFPLSPLWIGEGMAGSRTVGVRRVWMPDFGDRRNNLSRYADSLTAMVSRHVVDDDAEEWRQRVGAAAPTANKNNIA
jgi:hypothetical protein